MKKQRTYPKKLFLTYSSALLVVLLISFVFLLVFIYNSQYKKSMESQSQLVLKTKDQLDASLQGMDRIINGLLFNKTFMQIMKDDNALLHYTENSKKVLNCFVALDAPRFPTHRIIAFDSDIYYTLAKTGEEQARIKAAIAKYKWRETILNADAQMLILPIHIDPFDGTSTSVYSVARRITDGKGTYGIIEVQNSYADIESFCSIGSVVGDSVVFSQNGGLIYPSSSNSQQKSEYYDELYKIIDNSANDYGTFTWQRQQISYSKSDYSDWTTVIYCPVSSIVPYASELIIISVAIFFLLAAISLFMMHILTKRMTAPLLDLNEALGHVSLNNLSISIPHSYNIVEIENINHSFYTMFSQLKEAIAVSVQSRANEERANYLALQSQMNPHTIYNTIAMIESVSYMNGDKVVSNLCICFSQMLRYISDYTKDEYTIKDEVQHLLNYSPLVEKRYFGKLSISVNANEELLSKIVPKFSLQPLVENAVKHGFGLNCKQLVIEVIVENVINGWHILVKDNGCGFTQEKLQMIYAQFAHCDDCLQDNNDVINMKIGNLALSNIYVRCRILYGDKFHFIITNNDDNAGGCIELLVLKEGTPDD